MYRRYPRYPDDADYQTNAPSYYDDLARKNQLIKELTKKIMVLHDDTKLTIKQFNDRLNNIKEEMKDFFGEWLEDGTIEEIINEVIFNKLNDKIKELEKEISYHDLNIINVNKKFPKLEGELSDSNRIERALQSIENGSLYFEKGEWVIDRFIECKNNVNILGEGIEKTIFKPTISFTYSLNNEKNIFRLYNGNGVQFKNFSIDSLQSNILLDGIRIEESSNIIIDNVKISSTRNGIEISTYENKTMNKNILIKNVHMINNGYFGIACGTSRETTIKNSIIESNGYGSESTNYSGINFLGDKTTVTNCKVFNNARRGIDMATKKPLATQAIITNNEVFGHHRDTKHKIWAAGIRVRGVDSIIKNNTVYDGFIGIESNENETRKSGGNIIADNIIYDMEQFGIFSVLNHKGSIMNNKLTNTGINGIECLSLEKTTKYLTIENNIVTGNLEHGIRAIDHSYLNVSRNTCLDNGELDTNEGYGIRITRSNNDFLIGNIVSHNKTHNTSSMIQKFGLRVDTSKNTIVTNNYSSNNKFEDIVFTEYQDSENIFKDNIYKPLEP